MALVVFVAEADQEVAGSRSRQGEDQTGAEKGEGADRCAGQEEAQCGRRVVLADEFETEIVDYADEKQFRSEQCSEEKSQK